VALQALRISTMRARMLVSLMLLSASLAGGCGGRRAAREDCISILHRLVDLELEERGFRDPALSSRRRAEAERTHAADLAACEGKRMPRSAMACVRAATSSEELSHRCFD
jgi:hypothetical protein